MTASSPTALLAEFQAEISDHLAAIELALLAGGTRESETPPVDLLFRSFHSVKGLARILGDQAVETVTHAAESLLGAVRARRHGLDPAIQDALISALDETRRLTADLGADRAADATLLARLESLASGGAASAPGTTAGLSEPWQILSEDEDLIRALLELTDELVPPLLDAVLGQAPYETEDVATLVHAFGRLHLTGLAATARQLNEAMPTARLPLAADLVRGIGALARLFGRLGLVPLGATTREALAAAAARMTGRAETVEEAAAAFSVLACAAPEAPALTSLAWGADPLHAEGPIGAEARAALVAMRRENLDAPHGSFQALSAPELPLAVSRSDLDLRSAFVAIAAPATLAEALLVPDAGEESLGELLEALAADPRVVAVRHAAQDGHAGLAVLLDPDGEPPASRFAALAPRARILATAELSQERPTRLFAPPPPPAAAPEETQVRVPIDVLDRLFGRVGEFFSIGSWLNVLVFDGGMQDVLGRLREHALLKAPDIAPDVERLARYHRDVSSIESEVNRLVSLIHESTLGLRVIPLDSLVNRFPRMIRDTARETGKAVRFEAQARGIKIDKGMSEMLADPLMHILRNAVDHGIEPPETRAALGKPPQATLRLDAVQTGNRIQLSISDDGRGIDLDAVRRKAVAARLMSDEEAKRLSDAQVARFIFSAGLSTAGALSIVSGRGVGLDVALVNITKLGGRIDVETRAGVGTTFLIDMPLTAAIQPMLLVETTMQAIGFPEAMVAEVTSLPLADVQRVNGQRSILSHGRFLPIFDLAELLHLPTCPGPSAAYLSLVICAWNGRRLGVVVQRILRRHEMLIRDVHPRIARLPGVGGVTTLGFDRIVLVVDPDDLFEIAARSATTGVQIAAARLSSGAASETSP